jgi:ubiquitin carboxyl-terminal hydrolase 7
VVAQTDMANTAEVASTAESQPPEDPKMSRFTWTIRNFTRFNGKKLYSDVFVIGGYKW